MGNGIVVEAGFVEIRGRDGALYYRAGVDGSGAPAADARAVAYGPGGSVLGTVVVREDLIRVLTPVIQQAVADGCYSEAMARRLADALVEAFWGKVITKGL